MKPIKTIPTIIKRLNAVRPRGAREIEAITGHRLKKLSSGCSREAFKLEGLPLVVKIPYKIEVKDSPNNSPSYALDHARREFIFFEKMKKIKQVKHLVPKIYYFDRDTGIIAMRHYEPADFSSEDSMMNGVVYNLLGKVFNIDDDTNDFFGKNLGRDGRGRLVVLDAGLW